MTLDEVMMKRRSIRNYDAEAVVTEEQLRQIVSAAQEAPSWKNQETTRYHIAFSDEKFKAVQQCLLSTITNWATGGAFTTQACTTCC